MVTKKTKPYYQLYTGGQKKRFKLASIQYPIFWGCMTDDYSGVWLFRNTITWQNPVIEPITSVAIEHYKSLQNSKIHVNHHEYWANYFAQTLIQHKYSLLHEGNWAIKAGLMGQSSKSDKQLVNINQVYQNDGIFLEQIDFIDWGINGSSELIASKSRPADDSPRVKWWRKKVKEDACPPVLAWFINSLDAYLIIDGHSRLCAYQLESKPIQLLLLYAYQIETPKLEDIIEMRRNAFYSLKSRLENKRKNFRKPLSIDDINDMLINMYDNKYESWITKGTPIANFDKIWEDDIKPFQNNTSLNQNFLNGLLSNQA